MKKKQCLPLLSDNLLISMVDASFCVVPSTSAMAIGISHIINIGSPLGEVPLHFSYARPVRQNLDIQNQKYSEVLF
ncbi:MAG: hypothetical protein PHU04_05270 [Candidatus Peribacteraceae bacterium]|nr:hypothetical protein [Candidatus Peribacteraceae bacterium]